MFGQENPVAGVYKHLLSFFSGVTMLPCCQADVTIQNMEERIDMNDTLRSRSCGAHIKNTLALALLTQFISIGCDKATETIRGATKDIHAIAEQIKIASEHLDPLGQKALIAALLESMRTNENASRALIETQTRIKEINAASMSRQYYHIYSHSNGPKNGATLVFVGIDNNNKVVYARTVDGFEVAAHGRDGRPKTPAVVLASEVIEAQQKGAVKLALKAEGVRIEHASTVIFVEIQKIQGGEVEPKVLDFQVTLNRTIDLPQ